MRCRSTRRLFLFLAVFAVLALPGAASATLIGDVVHGDLQADGQGVNFLDPSEAPGHQASDTGPLPLATVQDPDTGAFAEFFYTDGDCETCRVQITFDVDATSLTITASLIDEMLPAGALVDFHFTLSQLDFEILDAQIASSDFTGLGVSHTATTVTVDYAGGDPLASGTLVAVIDFTLGDPVPEPGTALLLGAGIAALGARRRR